MRLLLDTHIVLWSLLEPARLSAQANELLTDSRNELLFSTVCIWEVSIKYSLGKPDFVIDPAVLRRTLSNRGDKELTITSDHAIAVSQLPRLHRDPFDRLLVAQAISEGLLLLTSDPEVASYSGPVQFVG